MSIEPEWLIEARKHIGLREVAGSKHNSKILQWLVNLKAWWKDDETPWCGVFVANCLKVTNRPIAKHWYRAKDWSTYGVGVGARLGAIIVFTRTGGGHVGFLVGQSPGYFHVLGGNQDNSVSIAKLLKTRAIAIRWPATDQGMAMKSLAYIDGSFISDDEA